MKHPSLNFLVDSIDGFYIIIIIIIIYYYYYLRLAKQQNVKVHTISGPKLLARYHHLQIWAISDEDTGVAGSFGLYYL